MTPLIALLGTLFATGLLGSFGHCIGMCGPLVTIVSLRIGAAPANGGRAIRVLPPLLKYSAARIAVYAALGAAAGGVGSLVGLGRELNLGAAVAALLLGISVTLFGAVQLSWLSSISLWKSRACVTGAIGHSLGPDFRGNILVLGALNGLLPCGLVYGALMLASSGGDILSGALGMSFFGLGTVPLLLVVGAGAVRVDSRMRQLLSRGAGGFIVITGLQLVLRAAASLGVAPHLYLAGVMIW